jgi:CheY-like chemotaxis protein
LRVDVIDTGIGVAVAHRDRIFQPFVQADASATRKFGGIGLGLPIARKLARLLGGDVTVTSQPRKGSCFTLTIDTGPLAGEAMVDPSRPPSTRAAAVVEAPVGATPSSGELSGARILLVEDGPDNQLLLECHLRAAGAEVVIADNGAVALNHVLVGSAAGRAFDLIVMDMQMPYMDGYTAAATLRAQGYATPILALTAHALPEDRAKCLSAGCTDYLSKPVERQVLIGTIRRHLRAKGTAPATTAA